MKRILFLLLFLPCLVFADQHGFDLLTGGATSALDGIAEVNITDADIAAGRDGTNWRTYYYDATSAAAESSPDIIAPDDVAANGRWLIIGSITAAQVAYLSGTIAVNDIPKFSDSVTMIGRSYSEHLTDVGLANTDSPAFNAMTLTGTNSLALGTFSTTDGMIFFNNATNANTFTIETGVTGAAIGWVLPTAAAGGASYLLNVAVDGTMDYTDPASFEIADAAIVKSDEAETLSAAWDLGTPSAGVLTNATGLPYTGLADGTDGEIITWAADGTAAAVAVGTATHVLTSNGVGAAPTFQASASGGNVSTSGTPVINDFAKFVDGTDIEGRSYAETKFDLSIDAVDNTADSDKPLSSADTVALALKMALAGTETVTGDKTFTGTIGIGNLNYNATLGTNNTYSGQGISGKNAGETIALWDLVYFDATAGEYLISDNNTVSEWPAWGFATTTGTDGNALTITQDGMIRNDTWAWSAANVPLYLSATPGGLTETAPSTDGDCIQPVAVTVTADIIMINVDPIFGYGESN